MKTIQKQLTDDQKDFFDEFLEFLQSDELNVFILKGYAGTGKTFMIKEIVNYLEGKGRKYRLMAPTGRAAKVITEKTGRTAYTIHKSIYSFEKIDIKKGKKNEFKYSYKLRTNDDDDNAVYIVDEASMISSKYSEGEFLNFGSGELLRDLFAYVHQDGFKRGRKILFAGDDAQLPPVNTTLSPALSQEILEGFGFGTTEFFLEEIVRQKKESSIIFEANNIRTMIETDDYTGLDLNYRTNEIKNIFHDEFLDEYLSSSDYRSGKESIVLTFSNNAALHYNRWIRNHFFPEEKTICAGDRVMVTTNNYSFPIELLNGDFGTVIEVSDEIEEPLQPVYVDNFFGKAPNKAALKQVNLKFRECVIRFIDVRGVEHDLECKVLETLLYSTQRDLTIDERKGLIVDFQNRNPKLKPGTKEFVEALGMDDYSNALRLKFGYAITGHKSQGGEWDNVFLDIRRPAKADNESYHRWLYTCFTRAKERLYIIKPQPMDYDF